MEEITKLLQASAHGDLAARNRVFEIVYGTLRSIASRAGRSSGPATLETTGLVHECYLRLAGAEVNGRGHFYALAATAMRQILCDHARKRGADKRGAGQRPASLEAEDAAATAPAPDDLLIVDQLLTRLAHEDARAAQVLEARVFGGLSAEETAEALGVSLRTVHTDTQRARAWLGAHWDT